MKNKISEFMVRVKEKNIWAISVIAFVFVVVIGFGAYVSKAFNGGENQAAAAIAADSGKVENIIEELVATVGAESSAVKKDIGNSWPGEIISSEISQIQPQRQGVIVDWRVNVGDAVSQGDILGKISAPPATPELIKMLAEQTEAVTRAKAQVVVTDEFSVRERTRLDSLKNAIINETASSSDLTFTTLSRMREKVETKMTAMRSFVERAISGQVATISNVNDFRYFRYESLNRMFGLRNQDVQNTYERTLLAFVDALKNSQNVPVEPAQKYFAIAVALANNSGDDEAALGFKTMAASDQKEFLDFLADYREAQTELADKETEYKIMISEKSAEIEKDRSMARADATAAEAAYNTVSREINGGSYIISPRAGTISAIYKKVGDLVLPEMPIAVVAGYGDGGLVVRMRIPGNIQKPEKGDIFSVIRPGFQSDIHQSKLIGIGSSLDETGSYMADALLIGRVDWPAGASVRVFAPENSNNPVIKFSSVWWSKEGIPHVWGVTETGRVFARKITIGRTLGDGVEVYDGIKNGDRYVPSPTLDIHEGMLLGDLKKTLEKSDGDQNLPVKSSGHGSSMPGMEM